MDDTDSQATQSTSPHALIADHCNKNEALHQALAARDLAAIERLIAEGADVDAVSSIHFNETPLHIATYGDRIAAMQLLIAEGANVNASVLSFAARKGRAAMELLIATGVDISAGDKYYLTPLHLAALTGQAAAIEILVAEGADVKAITNNGQTPLGMYRGKDDHIRNLLTSK